VYVLKDLKVTFCDKSLCNAAVYDVDAMEELKVGADWEPGYQDFNGNTGWEGDP